MQHTIEMQQEECEAHDMKFKYENTIEYEYLVKWW